MLTTYERRNEIIRIIRSEKCVSGARLARLTGVSLRTVRRDIDAISAYVPIYCDYGCHGGVKMMDIKEPSLNSDAKQLHM